jgi:hypothetical protein
LRDFLNDCVGSAASEEVDRIREAGLLLQREPRPGGGNLDLVLIETMLNGGAAESAVMAMVGPEQAFILSRGRTGTCLATVVNHDGSEEMIAEGATIALALLGAFVSLRLAEIERGEDAEAPKDGSPSSRLH